MRARLSPQSLGTYCAKEALSRHEADAVRSILALYDSKEGEANYIGEAISQKEHAAQAARAALEDGFDEDSAIAALFHDVGHLLSDIPRMEGNLGAKEHELVGSWFLRTLGFSDKICALVERHVDAKRYLTWKMPEYYNRLSDASKGTLKQQGGPMTKAEGEAFERDPLFKTIIAMRMWDEKAKVVDMPNLKPVSAYADMLTRSLRRKAAREMYLRDGFVVLKNVLTPELKTNLVKWADEIQNLDPAVKGKWMIYYETIDGKEKLCRTENFLPYHEGFRTLLCESELKKITDDLLGEESTLFKEKINYKLPGGGGFPAHQDAPAFTTFGQKNHLTVNVALDAATPENGCLEVAVGQHERGLFPQNPAHGGLTDMEDANLTWTSVPLDVGDVLVFSSWLPHRSGPNTTNKARRALYVTYNSKNDGDFREKYYVDKREHFPPKNEREEGKDYSVGSKTYNLATPITN